MLGTWASRTTPRTWKRSAVAGSSWTGHERRRRLVTLEERSRADLTGRTVSSAGPQTEGPFPASGCHGGGASAGDGPGDQAGAARCAPISTRPPIARTGHRASLHSRPAPASSGRSIRARGGKLAVETLLAQTLHPSPGGGRLQFGGPIRREAPRSGLPRSPLIRLRNERVKGNARRRTSDGAPGQGLLAPLGL